jgi:hypothetical protein
MNKIILPEEYFDDPVNTTLINERCIEIEMGIRYLNEVNNENVVEVGCVMPFYGYPEHKIVDLFEKHSPAGEVLNIDAEEYDFTDKNVLSLSTIEHIGKSDYDNTDIDPQKAVRILDKILKQSKTCLVTWGTRYHNELDTFVKNNLDKMGWFGYVKTQEKLWEFTAQDMRVWDMEFDTPFRYANGNVFIVKGV